MAHTKVTKTGTQNNGTANTFSYSGSFDVFKASEVEVRLDNVVLTFTTSTINESASPREYTVDYSNKTVHIGGANLTSNDTVIIQPTTDIGSPTARATYEPGSSVSSADLNNNQLQLMRKLMEHEDRKLANTGGTMTGDLTLGEDRNIIFEGATDDGYETTITVADPTADRTITFPNVSGNVVTTGDTGTVTSTMITNDTIVDADINSSAAIAGTKISPVFGGQTIITTGNAAVGGTLAVTGAVDINGGANIDNIQIGVTDDNEIDTASGNLTIDSAGGTTTIDDALAVTGGVSLDTTLGVTGTSTLANVTGGAVVTSGTSTSDTKVYSAKRAGEIFYGKDTVEEIQSGETWSSADDKVATTAAIDARIIDLVDDVGGFVPIANELSFPNANPDVNNGAGTLISIKALSTAYTSNSSGEISISNGTVGNSTVTITGAGNTVTYAQTLGMIVETTSTLNTYTFHRQTPDATTTTTVANNTTNINKVAAIDSDVTTVANIDSNVTTVAGDTTEINALAAKTTELGLLGTAAVIEDLGILGTADVVSDLNTLGTADVVSDMNALAVSDVISDMNTLAVTDVINDMDTVATNVTNVNNVGGSITSVNTAAANLTSIANFGDLYQVNSNDPTTDGGGNSLAEGDLYFNTSANRLKVYDGSSWVNGVEISGSGAVTTGNTFTGDNRYNDGVKALFGTGSDLEIYHTGAGSYIADVGTGNLHILSNQLQIINAANSEIQATFQENGAVSLYYDNTKKLETTSTGATINGNLVTTGNVSGGETLTITGNDPNITFVDSNNNPDYKIFANAGTLNFYDSTNNQSRLLINTDGHIDLVGHVDALNGIDVTGNITVTGTVDGVDIAALNTTVGNITTDVVSDTSPQLGGDLDLNGNSILLDDNEKIFIGTSNDGSLFNNGSWMFLKNHSGAVAIQGTNYVSLQKYDNADIGLQYIVDGAVKLYYDNSIKFETHSAGVSVLGNLNLYDNNVAKFGNNSDLQIYHDGGANYIQGDSHNTYIWSNGAALKALPDAQVELYYDNSKKFETKSYGGLISGNLDATGNFVIPNDTGKFLAGASNDLQMYHDGSSSYISNTTGNLYIEAKAGETAIQIVPDGAVDLRYNGVKKFETYTYGVEVSGTAKIESGGNFHAHDNVKFIAGTGEDLQIYHDSVDSYLNNSTGVLYARGDTISLNAMSTADKFFDATNGGAANLYYDNSKKFETVSNGVSVTGSVLIGDSSSGRLEIGAGQDLQIYHDASTGHNYINSYNGALIFRDTNTNFAYFHNSDGHFLPWTTNTFDLGSSGNRWRNIYTNDLNLSNEGGANDVDGTWGDWTIQEGESDLFLKNNRSGKKYKFNLTEVS